MITKNRKAYFEYQIIEEYDCGIILTGSEVKSIRRGDVTLVDSYAYFKSGELWIKNLKVSRYKWSHKIEVHDENREKKLLLHKKEIAKIDRLIQDKGTTIIPLGIFIQNNRLKLKIGVCKGKKLWNKKQDIKQRDIDRDAKREMNFR
jgi:SsrA-binding protein